jgi:hypothetical protein
LHLVICLVTEVVNAISAIEGGSDLLISLNETFEFAVEVLVLVLENVAVVLKGVDFGSAIVVSMLEGLVGETEIVLFSAGNAKIFFAGTHFAFKGVEVSGECSVAGEFVLRSAYKVVLFSHFEVKSAREADLFFL